MLLKPLHVQMPDLTQLILEAIYQGLASFELCVEEGGSVVLTQRFPETTPGVSAYRVLVGGQHSCPSCFVEQFTWSFLEDEAVGQQLIADYRAGIQGPLAPSIKLRFRSGYWIVELAESAGSAPYRTPYCRLHCG